MILKNYRDITDLKLSGIVTDIIHLTKLTRLILPVYSCIKTDGFNKCTKITNLDADMNYPIEDINFLTNMTELSAVNDPYDVMYGRLASSGLTDEGIEKMCQIRKKYNNVQW